MHANTSFTPNYLDAGAVLAFYSIFPSPIQHHIHPIKSPNVTNHRSNSRLVELSLERESELLPAVLVDAHFFVAGVVRERLLAVIAGDHWVRDAPLSAFVP